MQEKLIYCHPDLSADLFPINNVFWKKNVIFFHTTRLFLILTML